MNDDDNWKEIESLNWAKDCDYERIQHELALDPVKRERLREFVHRKKEEMYALLATLVPHSPRDLFCNTRMDSLDDAIVHTIGLGRESFEAALGDPELLRMRWENNDYRESFVYAFLEPLIPS